MTKISREEVLKIAAMSNIALHEDEIEPLIQQLEQVLSYAARVAEVEECLSHDAHRNVNIFREDVVECAQAQAILSRAPEREGDYFVVPKIIENS